MEDGFQLTARPRGIVDAGEVVLMLDEFLRAVEDPHRAALLVIAFSRDDEQGTVGCFLPEHCTIQQHRVN